MPYSTGILPEKYTQQKILTVKLSLDTWGFTVSDCEKFWIVRKQEQNLIYYHTQNKLVWDTMQHYSTVSLPLFSDIRREWHRTGRTIWLPVHQQSSRSEQIKLQEREYNVNKNNCVITLISGSVFIIGTSYYCSKGPIQISIYAQEAT